MLAAIFLFTWEVVGQGKSEESSVDFGREGGRGSFRRELHLELDVGSLDELAWRGIASRNGDRCWELR